MKATVRFTVRFKVWLSKKWDTAESWLPGFLVAISVLVIVVVAATRFFGGGNLREPAAFVEISDSEIPADTIYAADPSEKKLTSKQYVARRRESQSPDGASRSVARTFIFAVKDGPSLREISERTGTRGHRARAVVLAPDLLGRSAGQELALRLELFEDTQPIVIFKVVSGYEVNSGIHTGHAADDPASQVQLATADGMVSGTVKYRGKTYRIFSDPERGIHYIVEIP